MTMRVRGMTSGSEDVGGSLRDTFVREAGRAPQEDPTVKLLMD
jgi:hypothetical protein